MKDNDYVALVVCEKFGDNPIDWKADHLVQFISIKELRNAEKQNQVVFIQAKGAQEGFEARITWPASLASSEGTVTEIGKTIKYKTVEGKIKWVGLSKGGKTLTSLVNVGDKVFPNQILASVIKAEQSVPITKANADYFLANLSSLTLSERYAAAKALNYFNEPKVITALKEKIKIADEDIYVKLEAAASLARLGNKEGYEFIQTFLKDPYLGNVLECVIVLAEIKT
ncbi:MAG: HEAT repeat domain-containing protein, partial [Chitinophagaceae bacterium]